MYISLHGKLFLVLKKRDGQQYLSEVAMRRTDSYKYMKVEDCIKSNEEHGLYYVCNGDFNSLSVHSVE